MWLKVLQGSQQQRGIRLQVSLEPGFSDPGQLEMGAGRWAAKDQDEKAHRFLGEETPSLR